mmetsp:Transcript_43362/g.127567  ORF Transcript_43362/g.127567 Transcript_43362/m.127567 type:complete len:223 (+) Transcript_43362:278-946(+)
MKVDGSISPNITLAKTEGAPTIDNLQQVLQPVQPPPALVLPLHLCTQGDTDIVPGSKSATSPDVTIFTANAAAFRVTVVEGSLSAPTNHITTTNVSAPRRGHIDAVFAAAAERASENIQPNISSLVARQKQCVSSSTPRQNKYFTPAYNATNATKTSIKPNPTIFVKVYGEPKVLDWSKFTAISQVSDPDAQMPLTQAFCDVSAADLDSPLQLRPAPSGMRR